MTAKTISERQREFKKRQREAGLKEVRNLWAPPADHPAIKAYALKLQKPKG